MRRYLLKSKLHRARVTDADLHYEGSITIDAALLAEADIWPHEQVDVVNINNGARFTTYALEGESGSGVFCLNGAAARLAQPGDLVIVMSYASYDAEEASSHAPRVILLDEDNRPL